MSCKNRDREGASECTKRLSRVQRSCNSATQHIYIEHAFTTHIRHRVFVCAHDAANGTAISRTCGGVSERARAHVRNSPRESVLDAVANSSCPSGLLVALT